MPRFVTPKLAAFLMSLIGALAASTAFAWGDEGHEIVALIAAQYLSAPVKARVQAILATDHSALTADTSMASEATWADRYRDSDRDGARVRYERTRRWHYINLEIGEVGAIRAPDLRAACDGEPVLPPGTPASEGPAQDCIVDKIDEFAAELADVRTTPLERLIALQFLLHLVGDLHQPLHAADEHDAGGNRERVIARGQRPGSLHQYWDTVFVEALGAAPRTASGESSGESAPAVAARLIAHISAADLAAWQRGTPADWARQSFTLAARVAYGALPRPDARGRYRLTGAYERRAAQAVALQLSRAGVRLAMVLNRALG